MKVETKLNIGQEVYVIEDDKIVKGRIKYIHIHAQGQGENLKTNIKYTIDLGVKFNEPWQVDKSIEDIFENKEELIEYINGI